MTDTLLGLDEPPQPQAATPYRVLARKYRPQTFAELIGQDAMVTHAFGNAIRRGRLAACLPDGWRTRDRQDDDGAPDR